MQNGHLPPPPPIRGRNRNGERSPSPGREEGRKTKSGFEVFEGKRPRDEEGEKNYQHEKSGMGHRYGTGHHIEESFTKHHLKTIEGIAQKHLGMDTLETRRSGDHDFKEHAVWGIHDALKAAFQAGRMAK